MPDDSQLLRQFAANRSEAAFGELVARHVALVYSAAFRETNGDAYRAKDVAQLVFADLARKAPALSEKILLAGWLHRATIFAARQILRTERRRQIREQEAVQTNSLSAESENADWQQIRPLLDDALNRLNQTDRDALLLRFFENQTFAQVGASLGTAEEAARKRVNRALEKLREILARRGVTTTAAALSTVISANVIQAAPAGLAAPLTTASIATAGTTFTLLKMMTATKLKLALSTIVVAGAATAIVVQHQTQSKLRGENESLRQQITQLQTDNENYSNRLAEIGDAKKLSDEQFMELLKLRGEVGVLRRQTNELGKLAKLIQNQSSDRNVSPQEQQKRMAEYKLNDAKQSCLAFVMFAADNNGQFPTNFNQVARYITDTNQFQTFTNEFEIANYSSFNQSQITNSGSIILISERQAWPTYNGQWAKTYGFADGHAEVHVEPNDDFDAFERQHMVSPPVNEQ